MSKRVCLEPDCPELIDVGNSRCIKHERARDKARGTSTERGYDASHQRLRAWWQRKLDKGETIKCWRCDDPINPTAWHLGHDDHDRTVYRGPECVRCNTATASRRSP